MWFAPSGLHTRLGENAREIGYWINANYLKQGYATETVKALIKAAILNLTFYPISPCTL
ncbi:GNAT family N-acetyltransferase [Phaeodactylibacter luteus]|uniref:GNAT family N-acetyltransferase n=1 Tax=Phaeodactylibacter luteus TaxID=1564516 RepID=A0A5C6RGX3_9BACT|nr:GNAT family N-acetyltransferase [Phaeodactylibacter luteus]